MSKRDLTIIQLNDSHGYMDEHLEHFFDGSESKYIEVGGYSRFASYLKQVRKDTNNNVLFLDNGDTFHGTYPVVESKGKILIPLLNEIKLDAMTAHWDFAYGPDAFKDILKDLDYPMLAINVYDKNTKELVFDPYLIKEINEVKVGIIGIAATIVDKVMPKHFSEGLEFTMGNKELPKYIKELKKDKAVDIVVVLSHLGFPQEVKLANEVSGIDVLLSGHTHNRMYKPSIINNTIIIQSGCHGSFLGHLDLTYDLERKEIISYKHNLKVLDKTVKKEKQIQDLVDDKLSLYKDKLNKVVGYTKTNLNRSLVFESTMDNFLLNSIIDYTGLEIAFSNGWRYGAPILKGAITLNDLYNVIPVNPPVSTVKLSGQEIWDMLEENLERTFATDPYDQMGGYVKRSVGINVYFKLENTYGERIQYLFVNNKPIDLNEIYDVAFVTSQGVPSKYGSERKNLSVDAIEVLMMYLNKHKEVSAPLLNTFTAI